MLLGRTANGLYWMSRYIERAENMARLIDAGLRMALTKTSNAPEEWSSVVTSSGANADFRKIYDNYNAITVSDYILKNPLNPSSVLSCLESARTNARMVRTALTREAWESINETWINFKSYLGHSSIPENDLPDLLATIKKETSLVRGIISGTMMRNEIYNFIKTSTYIERADNTARILDVKYYVLLPTIANVGTNLDNYQWESILRSVSAHRSYRWVYEGDYKPSHIADFLILNQRMPRSLNFCYHHIVQNLRYLGKEYHQEHQCHITAETQLKCFSDITINNVFDFGLHEFLNSFIAKNNQLNNEIAQAYNFV
ncbi:alpha-E domain-containing protein [Entomobacter blattae]|uniref:DUF403 domain-containing protein n=1 Tax=Entomobacter blattae TaxID=2762277 RepID=A0A7H1NRN0_9PROT|nr:alpha-E domain-containing protein [Entomobacter blattae]QNT78440.1 hypothetical protein JGUZn3_12140 [Entomobacter blattae]